MINIGILQNEDSIDIYKIINNIVKSKENKLRINVDLISNKMEESKYNILISDKSNTKFIIDKTFLNKAIVLLNIDEKFGSPIKFLTPVKIITYGFNPKSCVTASSVINGDYNTIQFCIQRTLHTLQGQALYPQEFPVCIQGKSPRNVIAAVTTLILSGYDIDQLRKKIFV